MDKMLSVKEIANSLRISDRTVRNLIETGEIKAYKVGNQFRIKEEDFQSYLEKINTNKGDI